ncbi:hypothetical protein GCM10025876_23770 [Demequina litorisediminis]|uniref:Resolvase/invertase-type recombinase catalytic domain-containing protein n=1 Tax=Demequina litorisediminis TaxID=1849022 RepID=A0ABQ6IE76_9MICO|nr:hypothetical protein GCM10025876_23770 [Demequina litorisediminis]
MRATQPRLRGAFLFFGAGRLRKEAPTVTQRKDTPWRRQTRWQQSRSLADQFRASDAVVVTEYRGLSVPQAR